LYNSTVTGSASWGFIGSSADFAAEEVEGSSVIFEDGVDNVMFGLEFRDGPHVCERVVSKREGSERKVSERGISLKEEFLKETCFGFFMVSRSKGDRFYVRSGYTVPSEQRIKEDA
jgi:hypothetical protein